MKKTAVSFIIIVFIMLVFSLLSNYINWLKQTDLQALFFAVFYVILPTICAAIMLLFKNKIVSAILRIIPCIVFCSAIMSILSGFDISVLFKELYTLVFILPMYFISLAFFSNIYKEKNRKAKILFVFGSVMLFIILFVALWLLSRQIVVMRTTVEYVR